jgi:hypothetical protein
MGGTGAASDFCGASAGAGAMGATGGGSGSGTGAGAAGTGSAGGASRGGACTRFAPRFGSRACSASGNWVVACKGTLDSGTRENTGSSGACCTGSGACWIVMARLVLVLGALELAFEASGVTYCTT